VSQSETPWAAPGIAAEILFFREAVKKIAAESPVFCGFAAKKAPRKSNRTLSISKHITKHKINQYIF
jgi:hypothetical protein